MPKVFISYSHKDKLFALKLYRALKAEGVDVSIDEKDFQIGDSIPEKIGNAIDNSDFVIAVLSSSSVQSSWVLTELKLAITKEIEKQKKSILPIKIQDCDIPSFLKDKLYADFTEPDNFYEPFSRLLQALAIADNHDRCEYCGNNLPLSFDRCPHCGRPSAPPNVRAAKVPAERETLDIRYEAAYEDAASRGCEPVLQKFDSALAEAKVVIIRPIAELARMLASDEELYYDYLFNFYETKSGMAGEKENILRVTSEEKLFSGHRSDIRYAALSLNGIGLSNYGECSLVLREDMISYRTSLFEENLALFMQYHNVRIQDNLPLGYRATWKDRNKLAVAKLAHKLSVNTQPHEFPSLLLQQGKTFGEDRFIEAHIWGPFTIRAVERVIVQKRQVKHAVLRALREKLDRMDVKLEMC